MSVEPKFVIGSIVTRLLKVVKISYGAFLVTRYLNDEMFYCFILYYRYMRRLKFTGRKRSIIYLVISIASLIGVLGIIFLLPPTHGFNILNFKFNISILLLCFIFLFLFSVCRYFFQNKKHGIILGLFAVLYLVLRIFDFVHPLFLFLLIALFLSLELLLSSGQQKEVIEKPNE